VVRCTHTKGGKEEEEDGSMSNSTQETRKSHPELDLVGDRTEESRLTMVMRIRQTLSYFFFFPFPPLWTKENTQKWGEISICKPLRKRREYQQERKKSKVQPHPRRRVSRLLFLLW
jgi:hypothetical protein